MTLYDFGAGRNRVVKRTLLSLHDQTVELNAPAGITSDIEFLYRDNVVDSGAPGSCIVVDESLDGRFSIDAGLDPPVAELTRGDVATFVMEAVVRGLVKDLTTGIALHAGAVACNGKAAL